MQTKFIERVMIYENESYMEGLRFLILRIKLWRKYNGIMGFYIYPNFRRRGLGTSLSKHIELIGKYLVSSMGKTCGLVGQWLRNFAVKSMVAIS